MLNCLQRMALKGEETSSSDEEGGNGEDDQISHAEESYEREDTTDEEEEEEDQEVDITAKSEKNVAKSEGEKLDKSGLNEFLVKLRRPITQAKVIFSFLLHAEVQTWAAGACDPQVDQGHLNVEEEKDEERGRQE